MKVLMLYNDYRSHQSGEEAVVRSTMEMLRKKGIEAKLVSRSSKDLERDLRGKVRAFWNGIYSWSSYREIAEMLRDERPEIVHAHNLYPLFSPSVLVACRQAGVPAVLSVHNYGLTCPHWTHLYKSRVCERCLGGREYWCVIQNCQENIFESVGYALRNAVARNLRLFHDNVTVMVALTQFAKKRLVEAGFEEGRIEVLPNMVHLPDSAATLQQGEYAAFAGRMSYEKGVDTLLDAARRLPQVKLSLAGDGPQRVEWEAEAPPNASFVGLLERNQMTSFYRGARFLVVPSKWFEMCPLVISEAMRHRLAVIASRMGGLPELVEEGVTGLLFEAGNAVDLAAKIQTLWEDPKLCRSMGEAGREKAAHEYDEDTYYNRLMTIYEKAIELNLKSSR